MTLFSFLIKFVIAEEKDVGLTSRSEPTIQLIKKVLDSAQKHKIDVEMCGEMAGNPKAALLLFGLGLRHFSMSSLRIPLIKRLLRSISESELRKMASRVLKLTRACDIEQYITEWMEKKIEFKKKRNLRNIFKWSVVPS